MEAIGARHSVRAYQERKLEQGVKAEMQSVIAECNAESGLHLQLVTDEPKAFQCFLARYGKFSGVTNYIAMVGKDCETLDEKCGYYGQKIVLRAQQLGLNTCWVGLSYTKVDSAFEIAEGEKLRLVIAVGYGKTQGAKHKVKKFEDVAKGDSPAPEWFKRGVEAALLAPTALNQQKFTFTLKGNVVIARAGHGFYTKVDLGIVKRHFEIGAGTDNFRWG